MLVQDSLPYPHYYPSPKVGQQVYRVPWAGARPEWGSLLFCEPYEVMAWHRSDYYTTEAALVEAVTNFTPQAGHCVVPSELQAKFLGGQNASSG